ncbi:ATPase, P-type, K/Mg/Cd/Cu/Zn/Na/Ca/Na/H-transporter, partial [Caulochytrium protostelioides]
MQKAQVVRLVKRGLGGMCLSIGDGANDVSMIQEAHVGVGISGQEGMQAAMAADYVIGEFRHLSRLILVHGRYSYYRTTKTIYNFFFKNMAWVFGMFWYQIYCGYTADILYDYTYLMFYNLLFTSLPPIVMGIFDQDLGDRYCLAFPQLHVVGIRGSRFTLKGFWLYVADAAWQSACCFF